VLIWLFVSCRGVRLQKVLGTLTPYQLNVFHQAIHDVPINNADPEWNCQTFVMEVIYELQTSTESRVGRPRQLQRVCTVNVTQIGLFLAYCYPRWLNWLLLQVLEVFTSWYIAIYRTYAGPGQLIVVGMGMSTYTCIESRFASWELDSAKKSD
jgi:hypothetical protein